MVLEVEYPVIDPRSLTPLRIIQVQLAEDPGYLDHPECPYSPELKEFLQVFAPKKAAKADGTSTREDLEAEAAQLFDELKAFSSKISDSDVAERMSFFRTATSLLDKLVGLRERAAGLKQIHDFQETILGFLDEVCTPDQRTKLMERLKGVIG